MDDTKDVDTEEYQTQSNSGANKAIPKTAAAPTTEKPDYRSMLRALINDFKLDGNEIALACGLSKTSTDAEWKAAFEYAKGLVKQ